MIHVISEKTLRTEDFGSNSYRKQPWRSVISIKLQSNFVEITLRHECSPVHLLYIFRTPFPENTSSGLLLRFYQQFEKYFYMKIIGTIIPIYLVTNSIFFVLSQKPKARNKFSPNCWSGNEKCSCFLFIASRALLQGMSNSTDFYKGIFLHVIPIRSIVLWLKWRRFKFIDGIVLL